MPSIACEVMNIKGMHARAAAQIVKLTSQYQSKVTLTHKKATAPGDSLLKLLTLNAPKGSIVTVKASGNDADILLTAIERLFATGFGE